MNRCGIYSYEDFGTRLFSLRVLLERSASGPRKWVVVPMLRPFVNVDYRISLVFPANADLTAMDIAVAVPNIIVGRMFLATSTMASTAVAMTLFNWGADSWLDWW